MSLTMRGSVVMTTAVSVVCAALAYGAAVVASSPSSMGRREWLLLVGGAFLTLMSVGIPAAQQVRRQRHLATAEQSADAARAQLRTAFNDTLAPVAQQIGKVATAKTCERREALQAQTISKVLSSVVSLVKAARARACWFELDEGSPRTLRPVDYVGRSTPPSTVFQEGTRSGDCVFAALDRGEGRYVPSVDDQPPAGWDPARSRAYKTFIAVPVEAGGQLFGMLTLDSLRSADLTGDEVPGLRLLADLLADALAIGTGVASTGVPTQTGARELSLTTQRPAEVVSQ
jgi:hypothetical protein